ncbi:hypothetical protein DDE82_001659 [Stemphylium lycopersici]|uniref:Uncharacterized protein n=1 Tax=Stemphylium lycopersici TaxID=183478 RepID=A0A364NAM7_STELY|nr:hypothetical protein DDE82_001659 [Stemphylium lycopersici]RAR14247.1 hypothetical protein DDE83_002359 [Stemphylium lycopersici]
MNSNSENASNNTSGNQQEDYLDKGLDAAEKKWGGASAQDTEKNRQTNEKIEINRPMALVTCSKKQRAKTCPTKSPTKSDTTWKTRMHKLDDKWNKLRPYIERLNGTIVPLQSQEAHDDEAARWLEHEQRTVEEQQQQQLSARATL